MGRSFDVTSVVRPLSVRPDDFNAFVDGGRNIARDLPATFTFNMEMTPCVADNEDVDDILRIAGRCSWKNHAGSVRIPWNEAFQRGQLVKRLQYLGDKRGPGQKKQNLERLEHKLGLDTNRALRNYAALSTDLFEPYPVILLQWKGRAADLPTSWNNLYENRKKIVEFIKEHPDLEQFYEGKSCFTKKNTCSHCCSFAQVTQQQSILIRHRELRIVLHSSVLSAAFGAFSFTR